MSASSRKLDANPSNQTETRVDEYITKRLKQNLLEEPINIIYTDDDTAVVIDGEDSQDEFEQSVTQLLDKNTENEGIFDFLKQLPKMILDPERWNSELDVQRAQEIVAEHERDNQIIDLSADD